MNSKLRQILLTLEINSLKLQYKISFKQLQDFPFKSIKLIILH